MRKKHKQHPIKMKDGICRDQAHPIWPNQAHIRYIGSLAKTWGGCDKTSGVGGFNGGGGS